MTQCQAFPKIKLVYTEFTFAVTYTAEVNSVKLMRSLSLYRYIHIVWLQKIFAAVK